MLDEKTLDELKQQLLKEKEQLEKELGMIANKEDGEYEAKFEDYGREADDNAEEVEEYTNKMGITETLENKLKEINDALERIENGNYGTCENCKNEEIPIERLRAYPAARTCLHCKIEE